jgi:acyl-CoA synthetase (AMP-forming)/AMP-acid ligase II
VGTGDLGRVADDGHIELLARSSEVFKRYGEKISIPTIMETVTPTWRGRAASYREIDGTGEEGYVLVLAPHPDERDVRAILLALRSRHPRSHWPLRLESLVDLPLLPNGKVDTQALAGRPDLQQHWRQRI